MNTSKRISIYIRDEVIYNNIIIQNNRSEYVEKAIRFYEENKTIVERLANILLKDNQ